MAHVFDLLGKRTCLRLFLYFLKNPSRESYAAQLEREVRISKQALFGALADFEKFGILSRKQVGRTVLYSLKNDSVIVKQFKILLTVSELTPLQKLFEGSRSELYLFGSAARGENNEASDIDLLIVSEAFKSAVMALLAKAKIKNLKPVIFTPLEYAGMYKRDKAFYERIEKDRIRLV